MSYDVHLMITTGPDEQASVWSSNITYNVAPMLAHANFKLREWDGRDAAQLATKLIAVLATMADPYQMSIYKGLEPSNGWGTYEQTMDWLRELYAACNTHRYCIVQIS